MDQRTSEQARRFVLDLENDDDAWIGLEAYARSVGGSVAETLMDRIQKRLIVRNEAGRRTKYISRLEFAHIGDPPGSSSASEVVKNAAAEPLQYLEFKGLELEQLSNVASFLCSWRLVHVELDEGFLRGRFERRRL